MSGKPLAVPAGPPAAGAARLPGDGARMSFLDHLGELRRRIIWSLAAIVVAAVACWVARAPIFVALCRPLASVEGLQMVTLGPLEMFMTYVRLALVGGTMLAAPAVLLQVWLFVAPGLYPHERRWVVPFVVLGTACFVGGASFCFFLVLPATLDFLSGMAPTGVASTYSVSLYLSLILHLMLAFGVVFELPLVMMLLSASRLVPARQFARARRVWIVLAFVIGGVLTPTPDPATQAMMAVPLVLFFELGIGGARLVERRRAAGGVGL